MKIYIFYLKKERGLIRKKRLFSKFMTPSTWKQIITLCILPNISRNKGKQIMKVSQLIEYNMIIIFLHTSRRKWGRETSSRPFWFLTSFIHGKSKWLAPYFWIYFGSPRRGHTIKLNCMKFKTADLKVCSILIF